MRKHLKFADGTDVELSPLSYAEFVALDLYVGAPDAAFSTWKKQNGYVEVSDYRTETLLGAELEIVPDAPVWMANLKFQAENREWREFRTLKGVLTSHDARRFTEATQ